MREGDDIRNGESHGSSEAGKLRSLPLRVYCIRCASAYQIFSRAVKQAGSWSFRTLARGKFGVLLTV